MPDRKKIIVDDSILNGNPHVSDTRFTVFDIVSQCSRNGVEAYLELFSDKVSDVDVLHVLEYCRARYCNKDGSHCGGCSLRPQQDGIKSEEEFVNRFSEVRFVESDQVLRGVGEGIMFMPGAPDQFSQTWRGEDGWLLAAELLERMN